MLANDSIEPTGSVHSEETSEEGLPVENDSNTDQLAIQAERLSMSGFSIVPTQQSPSKEGESLGRKRSYQASLLSLKANQGKLQIRETSPSRPSYPIRCVGVGLGGSVSGNEYTGNLVSKRVNPPHQLSRAASKNVCYQRFYESSVQHTCLDSNRQHLGNSICEQNGGCEERGIRQSCTHAMGLVSVAQNHLASRTPARSLSRAKPDVADWRLDTGLFQTLCQLEQCTDGSFLQLPSGPRSGTVRCSHSAMERGKLLCIPSFQSDQQVPQKDKQRRGISTSDMPSMACPDMVPKPSEPSGLQPSHVNLPSGPPNRPSGQPSSTSQKQLLGPGRMEECQQGLSTSLAGQNGIAGAKRQSDPFRPPVKDVLHFLTELFDQASMGRWLKDVLKEAGVDTCVFKAHSTRSASTSSARRSGVSVQDIFKCCRLV
ncbi:hypothetical protein AC249_AIPGENE206 [Exaiptasia diaphana]|nr:hypothetical protein AC249_AIPGENE206 [Exaiptasia diaphana]